MSPPSPPSPSTRAAYWVGLFLVRGTVIGVSGLCVGLLTWGGIHAGIDAVPAAGLAGTFIAAAAVWGGGILAARLPSEPGEG